MIEEVIELLKSDFPLINLKLKDGDYDLYIKDDYINISFRDGKLGSVDEFYSVLKSDIVYYTSLNDPDGDEEDIEEVKISTPKEYNDAAIKRVASRSRVKRNRKKH